MVDDKPDSLIQDDFLQRQRQRQVPVSIYLISGIRLRGKIADFDATTILLKDDLYQLIYKSAIATIVPD